MYIIYFVENNNILAIYLKIGTLILRNIIIMYIYTQLLTILS